MGESRAGTILSPSLRAPCTGVPSPPQLLFLSPPVKRMTKDLSYAGSKNQIFLLAFSFVACRAPPLPHPPPTPALAPGWKPSLRLSYSLKPKFTVSVGGKTLSSPPPRVQGFCPVPLCSYPPLRRRERAESCPHPWAAFWGLFRPLHRTKSPSCWECGF